MPALAALIFTCTPVAVYDGDGPIWCADGRHLRLAGVAARELGGECRLRQPCPAASGVAARDALVTLLGGARGRLRTGHVVVRTDAMRCVSFGLDNYGRTVATCALPDGRDLGCALIATRTVLRWDRYWRSGTCDKAPS